MTDGLDDVDELLTTYGSSQLDRNGIPDAALVADRERCLELVTSVLGEAVDPHAIGRSPLGVGWTDVFDVPARGAVSDRFAAAGWLPLDRLLGEARRRGHPCLRWAVVEDGRVLGGVRLVDTVPDPVTAVLDRCRERSEVRLREVLELRRLRQEERPFPVTGGAALRTAAEIESALGGRLLAPWASGRSAAAPAVLATGRRDRTVAVSGVDGSGKSTLRAALGNSLERAGVQVSTVWVRPGMGLGWLTSLAAWGKRLLRQDAAPGLRAMADPQADRPASRQGLVGWTWALLVTVSFLVGVWRQHRAARGVVIYDRHLVDALATLDFAYDGVDLRLQRRLIRALLPRADVRLYIDIPAEVSVSRKPDDLLGEHAIRGQLTAYGSWLDRLPPAVRLDGTAPAPEVLAAALRAVAGQDAGHNRSPRR